MAPYGTITRDLRAASIDRAARERLYSQVYLELRQIASRRKGQFRFAGLESLTPTDLVSECYLRLLYKKTIRWESRAHFFGSAANAMLRVLQDRARRLGRERHGGGRIDSLPEDVPALRVDESVVLSVRAALSRLERRHPQAARVIQCRFVLGMTEVETAGELGICRRTVRNKWRLAQAWMRRELSTDRRTSIGNATGP